jgi:hypothetical protein
MYLGLTCPATPYAPPLQATLVPCHCSKLLLLLPRS